MRTVLAALIGFFLVAGAVPAQAQTQDAATPVVSCTTWGPDRVDCFARGNNAKMHHRWRDGANWGGWELLGGTLRSTPTCTSWAVNRIDCFVAGAGLTLWQRTWAGGPSWGPGTPITEGWSELGGSIAAEPNCVSIEPERIDCFAVDRERLLVRRTFVAGRWRPWERFPGMFLPLGAAPRCVVVDDGSSGGSAEIRATPIWCFVKGRDEALWMVRAPRTLIGATPPEWVSLGGVITSHPSCVANDAFTVRCFVRGTDNAMHWQTIDPRGGHGWRSLGGVLTSEPSCTSFAVLRIDCFVRGTDNAMHHIAATPSTVAGEAFQWSGWQTWGGGLLSAPTCVSHRDVLHMEGQGHARIDCFVRGTDRALWHIASYPSGRTEWRNLGGGV